MSNNSQTLESKIINKYSNSIIQLVTTSASYDVKRPFSQPNIEKSKGSSFIIDADNGLLLTNAHVVDNAISVKGLSPKLSKDIKLRVISLCREKDLAIVQVFKEDWDLLVEGENPEDMEMRFMDTTDLDVTRKVIAIGYPLGQDNLKFTPGSISGYENLESVSSSKNLEDDGEINSYIQTTAPINPGNSGGPLIDAQTGKVVGINSAGITFAQNVGYAISSMVYFSCYKELLSPIKNNKELPLYSDIGTTLIPPGGYSFIDDEKEEHILPYIVKIPQIGITYCRTSSDLRKYIENGKLTGLSGIHINKVAKDTIFKSLEPGSILTDISIQLVNGSILRGDIDNSGKITVVSYAYTNYDNVLNVSDKDLNSIIFSKYNSNNVNKDFKASVVKRKFTFREFMHLSTLNEIFIYSFVKNGDYINKALPYSVDSKNVRFYNNYLHFTPLNYHIFSGMSVSELALNHKLIINLGQGKYIKGDNKYVNRVIVTFVFPDTVLSQTMSLTEGDIIETINGKKISNIEDVKNALKDENNGLILVKSVTGATHAVSIDKSKKQDLQAMNAFSIK